MGYIKIDLKEFDKYALIKFKKGDCVNCPLYHINNETMNGDCNLWYMPKNCPIEIVED